MIPLLDCVTFRNSSFPSSSGTGRRVGIVEAAAAVAAVLAPLLDEGAWAAAGPPLTAEVLEVALLEEEAVAEEAPLAGAAAAEDGEAELAAAVYLRRGKGEGSGAAGAVAETLVPRRAGSALLPATAAEGFESPAR